MSEREIQRNDDTIIQVLSHEQIMMRPDVRANGQSAITGSQSTFNQTLTAKSFTFNAVFDQTASQSEMMEKSGVAKIIAMAMEGYSTTVFCYGQTGSGKTHSLTGPPHLVRAGSYLHALPCFSYDIYNSALMFVLLVPGPTGSLLGRTRAHLSSLRSPFRPIEGKVQVRLHLYYQSFFPGNLQRKGKKIK